MLRVCLLLGFSLVTIAAEPPKPQAHAVTSAPKVAGRPTKETLKLPYPVELELTEENRAAAIAFWEQIGKRLPQNFLANTYIPIQVNALKKASSIDLTKKPGDAFVAEVEMILSLTPEGRHFLEGVLPMRFGRGFHTVAVDRNILGWSNPKAPQTMEQAEGTFVPSERAIYLHIDRPLPEVITTYVHEWTHAVDYRYGPPSRLSSALGRIETEHRAYRIQQVINEALAKQVKNYKVTTDWASGWRGSGGEIDSMKEFIDHYRRSYAKDNGVEEVTLDRYLQVYRWDSFNLNSPDWWNQTRQHVE